MNSYKMKINGNDYEVAVKDVNGQNVEVEVNGKAYTVELAEAPKAESQSPLWLVLLLRHLPLLLLLPLVLLPVPLVRPNRHCLVPYCRSMSLSVSRLRLVTWQSSWRP